MYLNYHKNTSVGGCLTLLPNESPNVMNRWKLSVKFQRATLKLIAYCKSLASLETRLLRRGRRV